MVLTKWTSDTTSKFIALYREQECLWRTDSLAYRDKDARNIGLRNIIEGMMLPDLTPDEVKKKIKYLRSTYMVEVNKLKKSMRSGAGTGSKYKPTLSWFREMDSFIKYLQVKIHTQSTLNTGTENSNVDMHTEAAMEEAGQKTEAGSEHSDRKTETVRNQAGRQTETSREQIGRQKGAGKGVKFGGVSKRSHIQELHSVIKDIKLISEDLNKAEVVNEFDIFGKSVGVQLKALFEEDAIVAQEEIQSILARYRLKKIRHTNEIPCIADTTSSIYKSSLSRQSDSDGVAQFILGD
ncbi:uncharacterized protein LOC143914579 [Arctopsyche grandis]|uniref:uncharacterized protein LOC143914579 n=1 Tax=Arctopsyche grandis TaxID=121162 RepID=UPI00406D9FE9